MIKNMNFIMFSLALILSALFSTSTRAVQNQCVFPFKKPNLPPVFSTFNFGTLDEVLTLSLYQNKDQLSLLVSPTLLFALRTHQPSADHSKSQTFDLISKDLNSQTETTLLKELPLSIAEMTYDPAVKRIYFLHKPTDLSKKTSWSLSFYDLQAPQRALLSIPHSRIHTEEKTVNTQTQSLKVSAFNRLLTITSSLTEHTNSELTILKNDFPVTQKWDFKSDLHTLGIHVYDTFFTQSEKNKFILLQAKEGLFLKETAQWPRRIFHNIKKIYLIARDSNPAISWVLVEKDNKKILFAFDLATLDILHTQEVQWPAEVHPSRLELVDQKMIVSFKSKEDFPLLKIALPRPTLNRHAGVLPFFDLSAKYLPLPASGKIISTQPSNSLILIKGKLFGFSFFKKEFFDLHGQLSLSDLERLQQIESAALFNRQIYFMQQGSLFRIHLNPKVAQLENMGDVSYLENPVLRRTDNTSLETQIESSYAYVLSSQHLRRFDLLTRKKDILSLLTLFAEDSVVQDHKSSARFVSGSIDNQVFYFSLSVNHKIRPVLYAYDLKSKTLIPLFRWHAENSKESSSDFHPDIKVFKNHAYISMGTKLMIYSLANPSTPAKAIEFKEPIRGLYLDKDLGKYYVTLGDSYQLVELNLLH